MAKEERILEQQAAPLKEDTYAAGVRLDRENLKRGYEGKVVVKKNERPLQNTRQGQFRFYLHNLVHHDTVLKDWRIFVQEIHTHSGKHNHQGALGLFVLDGEGYTIVDGVKVPWHKGSLLHVQGPQTPHQHFATGDKPTVQLRFAPGVRTSFFQSLAKERFPYLWFEGRGDGA